MQIIPFDKRPGYIWVNGKLVKWEKANTHILNHGLHYGSCVFEGLRVYNLKIFKLIEHVKRLFFSKNSDMKMFSEKQICESIEKITKKQKVVNGYIR